VIENTRVRKEDINIDLKGIVVHVRLIEKYADRPTVVFLHDSLGCIQLWKGFPEILCDQIHCNALIYDRQGYGKSAAMKTYERSNDYIEKEADVLAELLEALAIKEAILFGHSDGGSIALIAAGKRTNTFKAVVVEAAHIFVEDVTLTGIRAAKEAYRTTDLKQKLEKYHGDKTETLFKAWTETWLHDRFRSWSIEHFLPLITCPVLFIQGESDEYGTVSQMEGVANKVNGPVSLALLSAVGHTPHKQAAAEVVCRVADFIKSNEVL
jgi:pimeloyl-ACP methyl ester carboxylesterase